MIAIGEASKQSGVSVETIRYYEREGIVPEPGRANNGWRLYTPDDVSRLRLLKRLRGLRFLLDGAKVLLDLSEHAVSDCDAVKEQAEGHIADVETKIAELKKLQSALKQLISTCSRGNADCPMLTQLRTE